MRWTKNVFDLAVILRLLVGIHDQETNRRTSGSTLEDTRQNLNFIGLFTLGREAGGAWLTSI